MDSKTLTAQRTKGSERVYVIIDPQVGFTDEQGSLALAFGVNELEHITRARDALIAFLSALEPSSRVLVVTSEYLPGQFTNGDLFHPFAHVCVKGANRDCDLSLPLTLVERATFFQKSSTSAMSSKSFSDAVFEAVDDGVAEFVLCGFLYTSCVADTALEMRSRLPTHVALTVRLDLCGTRSTKLASVDRSSTADTTTRLLENSKVRVTSHD